MRKGKEVEMSLSDIQKVSLEILDSVNLFCRTNNIKYSLGYGALIGAVRHKGFIPWDDDIDIIITRPEYEKFIKLFPINDEIQKKGLKLFAPELGNSYFGIARVCEMRKTHVDKFYQWTDEETGVWVDVFVIDALPEDKGVAIRKQNKKCFHVCGACVPISKTYGIKRLLKNLIKRFKYGVNREREIINYLHMIKNLPLYNNANVVCNFSSPYEEKDVHEKNCFEKYELVLFEGVKVSIISEYDKYLRNIYGDYMQLPPLHKRVRGHTNNKYFWI